MTPEQVDLLIQELAKWAVFPTLVGSFLGGLAGSFLAGLLRRDSEAQQAHRQVDELFDRMEKGLWKT